MSNSVNRSNARSREVSEQQMQASKRVMLARLLLLLAQSEAAFDYDKPVKRAIPMHSRPSADRNDVITDELWPHIRLTEPTPDNEGGVVFWLRLPDFHIAVVGTLVDEYPEFLWTDLVDLDILTESQIGHIMSAVNTFLNTR